MLGVWRGAVVAAPDGKDRMRSVEAAEVVVVVVVLVGFDEEDSDGRSSEFGERKTSALGSLFLGGVPHSSTHLRPGGTLAASMCQVSSRRVDSRSTGNNAPPM
jgi:hypothetical protein